MEDMLSYIDSHTSFFTCKMAAMGLASLFVVPQEQLPPSYVNAFAQIFTGCMALLRMANEMRTNPEDDEVDYEELMDRIQGRSFKQNDWGFNEECDVMSDDLDDIEMKQLEVMGGLGGDFVEIDKDLVNELTDINEVAYIQQAIAVLGNQNPKVAQSVVDSLNPEDREFLGELMKANTSDVKYF